MNLDEQLADAFVAVAHADHYMVGITFDYDDETLLSAEQILIDRDNAANNADPVLNLALDLVEQVKRERRI